MGPTENEELLRARSAIEPGDDHGSDMRRHAELLATVIGRLVGGTWAVVEAQGGISERMLPLPFLGPGVGLVSDDPSEAGRMTALAVLDDLRPLVEAVVEAERAEADARALAMTDHLTGLLNRWGWELALGAEESRCQRHGRSAVVAVVDLDDLKKVNDSDGHLGGDMMLRMAAEALRKGCRREDVVARIGGDEFALIAVEDRPGDEDTLAERLRATLAEAGVAASVGTAPRTAMGGLRSAFRNADGAMYADKLDRKRCVR